MIFYFLLLQMFDSNLNKDKLLRLKLGAGKVIRVRGKLAGLDIMCHYHSYGSLKLSVRLSGLGGGDVEYAQRRKETHGDSSQSCIRVAGCCQSHPAGQHASL